MLCMRKLTHAFIAFTYKSVKLAHFNKSLLFLCTTYKANKRAFERAKVFRDILDEAIKLEDDNLYLMSFENVETRNTGVVIVYHDCFIKK